MIRRAWGRLWDWLASPDADPGALVLVVVVAAIVVALLVYNI